MKGKAKTKPQLLLEMAELRKRLDGTERRLQEANERLQAQIAELKRVEQTSEKIQEYAENIVETIREPLIVLRPDLKVISANHSFYETFQVTPQETEGRFIFDIGNHQWDIPALRELLEEIIPQNTHFNNFEVDHEFQTIGRKRMLLNARRIYREGKGTDMILLAFEDITGQKQSEEALTVSETRYRRLFETAQDGILILDADTGQILDVNPFLGEMLGYSHEDFLGKKLWEIGAFKDMEASKVSFSELQTKGYIRYEDLPLETKAGRRIEVEFVSNVYLVDHKKVIQCNIRDITKRKGYEKQLEESHQLLAKTFFSLREAVFILDAKTAQIRACNPAASAIFGYSHKELLGQSTPFLHIDGAHLEEFRRRLYAEIKEKGFLYLPEFQMKRKNGEIFFTEHSVTSLEDHQGQRIGWVSVVRDITQRKQMEEALKISETRYRRLFETAQDGILILDADTGQITDVNPFLVEMLGYSYENFLGKKLWEIGAFKNIELSKAAFSELQNKGYVRYEDLPLQTKDGRLIEVEFVSNVYLVNHHKVIQCNIRDITERRRAEEALADRTVHLERLNRELVALNAELDDFTHVASHDLQEPLRTLTAFSDLLRKDLGESLPERAAQDLGFITDAAKRMQALIKDLLVLSRAGRVAKKREKVSLSECADRALEALAVRVEETGAEVTRDELPAVWCDPTLITELYQNLIGNALKFSADQRPIIRLTVEERGGDQIFGVKDHGIGIEPKYAQEIFEPFRRLHGRSSYEGTGIGLAICRKIVERHGGKIWVESEPGKGSHFRFTILHRRKETRHHPLS